MKPTSMQESKPNGSQVRPTSGNPSLEPAHRSTIGSQTCCRRKSGEDGYRGDPRSFMDNH